MSKTYLDKLEYNRILENLSHYCITYIGKNLANNLKPSNNKNEILKLLDETNEGLSILYKASNPPLYEIADIGVYLKILESGGTLSLKAILDLAKILKYSNDLKNYFVQDFINQNDFPILSEYFSLLYTNQDIYTKIFKIVIDENTISDDASSRLKDIRRNQRKVEQNIKNTLNSILN